jgi:hypothetical protein
LRRIVAVSSTSGSEASILAIVAVIDYDSAIFCSICLLIEASFASCSAAWARIDDFVRATPESDAPAGIARSRGITPVSKLSRSAVRRVGPPYRSSLSYHQPT